jgi:hypothetical protein
MYKSVHVHMPNSNCTIHERSDNHRTFLQRDRRKINREKTETSPEPDTLLINEAGNRGLTGGQRRGWQICILKSQAAVTPSLHRVDVKNRFKQEGVQPEPDSLVKTGSLSRG